MAHVAPLDRADLPEFEDSFQIIESVMGFIPRSMFTMGRNPALLRGFGALSFAVLGPGRIDGGLKQMIAHISSTASGCRYCQAHTASSAHRSGVDADKVAAVWEFETDERFTAAERAALALARDASVTPNTSTPTHFEALRPYFDDDDIVEIVSVISLFGWLNRWNDTMATDLEDEPLAFGAEHLAARGWEPGKHAHS
jgi:uncharacterized peroxidase-related enzyme